MSNRLIRYLLSKDYRFLVNSSLGIHRRMPDGEYIKRVYKARMGYEPDLAHPVTFNEKLQWLKLNDRNPAYHRMVDKADVKEYVAGKIGAEHIIPTIGVYDSFEEINFDKFPESFVLKCTHDSGGLVICKDKHCWDKHKAKKILQHFLKRDYYSRWREWPYEGLQHRIIAEQYLQNDGDLIDYKVHCFNGEPKLILVCRDRFNDTGLTEDFFTPDWEHLDVRRPQHPNAVSVPEKPQELSELLALAGILSADIPFVRVDFYIVRQKILFSEMTFFPAAGLTPFVPEEWDRTFGEWIDIKS